MAISYQRRLQRLLEILVEVKSQPGQPLRGLIDKLGISKAQFYKDRKILAELGFSFHYDRCAGRFVVDGDAFLPVEDLSVSERILLVLAVRQLSSSGDFYIGYHALKAAKKLIAGLDGDSARFASAVFDDLVLREGFGCRPDIVERLQEAVAQRRRIRIDYLKPGAFKPACYELDPYSFFFRRRALYVEGHCPTRKALRTFRVNRIQRVASTGIFFQPREDYDFGRRSRSAFSVFTSENTQAVRVRFSSRARPYIEEILWHPSQQLQAGKDDSLIFTADVANPREVLWWAMSWGGDAEILEPDWLRREAARESRKMAELYR
ncbi:helix-turn-helix transcriptional regulator [Desulfoglaeba alkanexedens]|uniref:WYL domain-containing protein n=1 Tax=Desulfoglaeba alkanexedens ALDC TaxID=980445 RepID=A0A4P8L4E8_9BACT|nr:WYL domain-containing protein [Desulfoglaeba alkanexedens]QCQ22808.1 WYL domain-containing protein [Desulfoglaeba alkanexedens ALDC]